MPAADAKIIVTWIAVCAGSGAVAGAVLGGLKRAGVPISTTTVNVVAGSLCAVLVCGFVVFMWRQTVNDK